MCVCMSARRMRMVPWWATHLACVNIATPESVTSNADPRARLKYCADSELGN